MMLASLHRPRTTMQATGPGFLGELFRRVMHMGETAIRPDMNVTFIIDFIRPCDNACGRFH